MHISTINLSSNKCTSWYNIHSTYKTSYIYQHPGTIKCMSFYVCYVNCFTKCICMKIYWLKKNLVHIWILLSHGLLFKEDEVGGLCGTCIWGKKRCIQGLVGKPPGKRPLERPRHTWKDNLKWILQKLVWKGVTWINLTEYRDKQQAVVNMVMNYCIQYNAGNTMTSRGTVRS